MSAAVSPSETGWDS